ncbi:hypothetical protein ACQPZJ_10030 [Actinoplanes sp. CA-054009]
MNQDLLDELIGVAPPSRVDVGAVITRTRRRQRRRRLAAGGSAAAAVVAVLSGIALTGGPSAPPPPSTSAASASAAPPALRQLRDAVEEATAAEAPGTAWTYFPELTVVAPGATGTESPDAAGHEPAPDGHLQMSIGENRASLNGRGTAIRGDLKGIFHVSLRAAARYECDGTVPDCETIRDASGLVLTRWAENHGIGLAQYSVDVTLPDQIQALRLQLRVNLSPDNSRAPVFTRAQLQAIAVGAANRLAGR